MLGMPERFRLNLSGIAMVQAITGKPILELNELVSRSTYDAVTLETIAGPILRLALLGAGLEESTAAIRALNYINELPMADLHTLVQSVWAASLFGVEPKADLGKTMARKASTSLRRMLSSLISSVTPRRLSTR